MLLYVRTCVVCVYVFTRCTCTLVRLTCHACSASLPVYAGVPPLSSSASVTVIVENVNDIAPQFVDVPLECIEVEETRGIDATVITLRVEDADSMHFYYSIASGQDRNK